MTIQQLEMINHLNQAFYLDKRINSLIAEKDENISIATRCTANYGGDGGNNPSKTNSQEKVLWRIAEQEQEITDKIDKLVGIREDISRLIGSVDDIDEQSILSYRYLSYKTMQYIAEKMHYHRNTIQNKHTSAIENLVLKCAVKL